MIDAWQLRAAKAADIDVLMRWFPTGRSVAEWGGPRFRHPFTRHSFAEDMHWGRMASFSLDGSGGELTAFGQAYERYSRINLARLVVSPDARGQGVGKHLVRELMTASRSLFDCPEFSLFVYRDNLPAYHCYLSLGFRVVDYPEDMPLADSCFYLIRPVEPELPSNEENNNDQ